MIPIVDVKTMQESDRATIESGTSARELMLRAAKGIFESYTWGGKTLIVCGVGNNAGDGYALATLLHKANRRRKGGCLHKRQRLMLIP